MNKSNIIFTAVMAVFLALSFVGGCSYHKKTFKCPTITTDTITVVDTVTHTIVDSFPYYISHNDTIIYTDTVFSKVDTLAILRDYFAVHVSDKEWKDSLLQVNVKMFISENELKRNIFEYKILRPQTVVVNNVDNSTTWSSYLNFGLDIPIQNLKYLEVESTFNWSKAYIGIGYTPELKSVNAKFGAVLFKFKKKR